MIYYLPGVGRDNFEKMTVTLDRDIESQQTSEIDSQDDFLRELYHMGLDLNGKSSKDLNEEKELIRLIDEQYLYPSEEHRMRIQIAWMRTHQYYLSKLSEVHVSAGQTVFNWISSYNDSGRNKYFDMYIKSKKLDKKQFEFARFFAADIGRLDELLYAA